MATHVWSPAAGRSRHCAGCCAGRAVPFGNKSSAPKPRKQSLARQDNRQAAAHSPAWGKRQIHREGGAGGGVDVCRGCCSSLEQGELQEHQCGGHLPLLHISCSKAEEQGGCP